MLNNSVVFPLLQYFPESILPPASETELTEVDRPQPPVYYKFLGLLAKNYVLYFISFLLDAGAAIVVCCCLRMSCNRIMNGK